MTRRLGTDRHNACDRSGRIGKTTVFPDAGAALNPGAPSADGPLSANELFAQGVLTMKMLSAVVICCLLSVGCIHKSYYSKNTVPRNTSASKTVVIKPAPAPARANVRQDSQRVTNVNNNVTNVYSVSNEQHSTETSQVSVTAANEPNAAEPSQPDEAEAAKSGHPSWRHGTANPGKGHDKKARSDKHEDKSDKFASHPNKHK